MSIQDELNQIKNAVYGADVRDAIHDSIKKAYDDASANGNANMEVEMARGTEPTLSARLDKEQQEVNAQLAHKASREELNALGKIELDGVYPTLNDLKAEFPEGNTGLFLVQSDGFTYRWNESNWVQVAQFQSDGLAENSVNKAHIKGFEVEGNIYSYPEDYEANTYYEIGGRKDPIQGWGSTTLPIDGSKYSKVSLWLPHGNYGGNIGSIPIMNVDKVMIKNYYANAPVNGKYKNVNYVTLDIPTNARFIGITVNNADSSLDAREDLVLVAGDTINDLTIKKKLVSLNGYDISLKDDNTQIKLWGAFGDSLTEKNSRSTSNYVDYVSNDLDLSAVNYGVGGTGYARGASSDNAFYQRILNISTNLDVVTIFGSFNDLGAELPLGTPTDTDLTTMGGTINQTLDNYNSVHPTTPLGVISPTPWNSTNPKYESNDGFQYVKLLEKICKDRGLPFLNLFHSSGLRPWEEEYRQLMYSRDEGNGVHPDENGHKLFYPQIREFIKTLI